MNLQVIEVIEVGERWHVIIPGQAAQTFTSRKAAVDYAELRSAVLDMPVVF
jgi:hypothetical protein